MPSSSTPGSSSCRSSTSTRVEPLGVLHLGVRERRLGVGFVDEEEPPRPLVDRLAVEQQRQAAQRLARANGHAHDLRVRVVATDDRAPTSPSIDRRSASPRAAGRRRRSDASSQNVVAPRMPPPTTMTDAPFTASSRATRSCCRRRRAASARSRAPTASSSSSKPWPGASFRRYLPPRSAGGSPSVSRSASS